MKRLQRCMRIIGVLMLCIFAFTTCWFAWTVQNQSSRWIATSYNTRLTAARETARAGDIYDRTGVILATTDEEGNRIYNDDKRTRRAVSQTVGDTLSMPAHCSACRANRFLIRFLTPILPTRGIACASPSTQNFPVTFISSSRMGTMAR